MARARIPFTREDEEKIASGGLWAIIVAVVTMATQALDLVFKLIQSRSSPGTMIAILAFSSIGIAITVILGIWLLQAGLAFRKVATTDVADEHYLLEGFTKLRNYFMMTGILMIVLVSLVGLFILMGLACGMMISGR